MICPKCGAEIADDNVYCGTCGEEIHFVPFFDPEIEQSITDNLSNLQINEYDENATYGDEYMYDGEVSFVDGESEEGYYDQDGNFIPYDESDEYYDEEYSEEYAEDYPAEEVEYADDSQEYYEDEYVEDEYSEYEDEEYDEYDDYDEYEDDEELDDFDEEFSGDPFDDFEYESQLIHKFFDFMKYSKWKWVFIVGLLLLIGVILYGVFTGFNKFRKNNSIDYQYNQALEMAMQGDYDQAIVYLEKAISLSSDDSSMKLLLADYYFKKGDPDSAIITLWEIIRTNDINATSAYKKMIEYYASLKEYEMINNILKDCTDTVVLDEYQEYLALEPIFSEQEGTYDDVVTLKLSSNCNGRIYYTTDGSTPTVDSTLYTGPITIDELGQHTITAFFVNDYGIVSPVSKKSYLIDIVQPNAPNVLLDSGTYDIPMLIEVDVQRYCDVYYTTDGTPPNLNSLKYETPIYMPIGQSHFIFVAFSQESKQGDITDCDYNLKIDSDVDISDINSKLLVYDFLTGKTVDLDGHMPSSTTKYQYSVTNAVTFNTDGTLFYPDHGNEGEEDVSDVDRLKEIDRDEIEIYYIVTETMIDVYGNSMKTGSLFLISAEDGTLYKAQKTEEGIIYKDVEITEAEYTYIDPNAYMEVPEY